MKIIIKSNECVVFLIQLSTLYLSLLLHSNGIISIDDDEKYAFLLVWFIPCAWKTLSVMKRKYKRKNEFFFLSIKTFVQFDPVTKKRERFNKWIYFYTLLKIWKGNRKLNQTNFLRFHIFFIAESLRFDCEYVRKVFQLPSQKFFHSSPVFWILSSALISFSSFLFVPLPYDCKSIIFQQLFPLSWTGWTRSEIESRKSRFALVLALLSMLFLFFQQWEVQSSITLMMRCYLVVDQSIKVLLP